MNILKTNHNNLDELVFENRNKAYGAYALRSDYNKNLIRSFLITFLLPMAIILTSIIYNKLHGDVLVKNPLVEPPISDTITIVEYILPPKELIKEIEKAHTKPAGNNNNYEVRRNEDTKPILFDSVARTNDLDLPIGPTNTVFNPIGTGTIPSGETGEVFDGTTIEQMPEFNGDLYEYLAKEIKYPKNALENGVQGKVTLSFIINKNGEVSDLEVLGKVGFGCDEEAMRVVKEMPKWKAGEQNNRKVAVKLVLPIMFEVNN